MEGASRQGAFCGFMAGLFFAAAQIVIALFAGNSVVYPFRSYASVALGEEALGLHSIPLVLGVGSVVHWTLSTAFGVLFGIVNAGLSAHTQASTLRQLALGVLFGSGLYLFNMHVVAPILFPWLAGNWLFQAVPHALIFGPFLGLTFVTLQRRVQRLWSVSPA
ncbi:MAG TPA: hypothetical protein VIM73_06845 [Polyangiaceae bacterium]